MSGSHAQVQLSNNIDFISDSDSAWYYNTVDNSSLFTINAGTGEGEMTVPERARIVKFHHYVLQNESG